MFQRVMSPSKLYHTALIMDLGQQGNDWQTNLLGHALWRHFVLFVEAIHDPDGPAYSGVQSAKPSII